LRRETGEHFFYKPVINFLDGQTASVYEFQARGSGDPVVVYCGSTNKERGDKSTRQRMQQYLSNGAHKAWAIDDALNRDYEIWVRICRCPGMEVASQLENELLKSYDYAWNIRDNGGKIRQILE
jgi:Uri superfamily endonuclease